MVKIRLARVGRKNDPSYRVVVQDSRKDPFGPHLEVVGHLAPRQKVRKLEKERILYWLKVGAQPTGTVRNLLISEGIIKGKKVNVYHPKKKAAEAPKAEAPKAEAKAAEAAPKGEAVKPAAGEAGPAEPAKTEPVKGPSSAGASA